MSIKIQEIIDKARSENRTFLLEPESKQIMKILEITTTEYQVATNKDEAKIMAKKIGYPIV
ncbi:MAG: acetate--CoA ligase family protein, partial [Candidatus Heimdallarchaeota archaeon]